MSISELAGACSVADATVSRFCRRLGYKGYPDFKIAIANASIHRLEDNPSPVKLPERTPWRPSAKSF